MSEFHCKEEERIDFITGEGTYYSSPPFHTVCDGQQVRIEPLTLAESMPSIMATALLILVGMLCIIALGYSMDGLKNKNITIPIYLISGLTPVVYTVIAVWVTRHQSKQGTLFVYDKVSGGVLLPREGLKLTSEQVCYLQYTSTRDPRKRMKGTGDPLSELNLVASVDGKLQRWTLLREVVAINAFEKIVEPFVQETEIKVIRVKGVWRTWETRKYDMRTGCPVS